VSGPGAARRQRLHNLERPVDRRAVGVEVAFQEQLGQAFLGVAAHVLPDLVERPPQRPAILPRSAVITYTEQAKMDCRQRVNATRLSR